MTQLPRMRHADTWWGYPKAAWLVIGVEFWERFSFYGMLSILILFLTTSPTHGGFGWSATDALALTGIYSGAMYAFPALGGYLADRVFGRRRAVGLGVTFMLLGQVLMASPAFIPFIWGAWCHAPLLDGLQSLNVPLGYLRPTPVIVAAIAQRGAMLDEQHGVSWLAYAYGSAAIGFYAALFFLVLGNALMKSSLVVLCGELFAPTDARREGAYSYYYSGIALGALLSGIAVGSIAAAFGWYCGFMIAAAGMLVAFGSYVVMSPRWLAHVGSRVERQTKAVSAVQASNPLPGAQATRRVALPILLLSALAPLLCVFSVGWFQLYGTWSLFIERFVDRAVGAFVVPVPWFGSLDAGVAIVAAPLLAAIWIRLETTRYSFDIVQKYLFALAMAAIAHVFMWVCAGETAAGVTPTMWLPVISVAFLALGELVAWTSTYALVSRAAPTGYASVAMGAWYFVTLGLGGYLAGFTGHMVDSLGYAKTFGCIAGLMAATAFGALMMRGPLLRLANRAEIRL